MDFRKLLRSVPLTRRATFRQYTALLLLWWLVAVIGSEFMSEYPFDAAEFALVAAVVGAFILGVVFLLRKFAFPAAHAELALEKADYMYSCISRLSPQQQEETAEEMRGKLGKIWHSKSYLFARIAAPPVFGRHCLFGKVAVRKTFGMNQHVILPYQNISEAIAVGSGGNRTVWTAKNARPPSGPLRATEPFRFSPCRPTVVVADDAGNAYHIDCPDSNWFAEKLGGLAGESAGN